MNNPQFHYFLVPEVHCTFNFIQKLCLNWAYYVQNGANCKDSKNCKLLWNYLEVMTFCERCGEDEFECQDGLYFCTSCHTQSQVVLFRLIHY